MANFPIQIDRDPPNEDLLSLDDRIYEHNRDATGKDDGSLFMLSVRDEDGRILAGLHGWTWAEACEIRCLWVDPALRGEGIGAALLRAAEDEARSKGVRTILLSSYSFQAPGFYQKYGYEVLARLEDFPPGCQNFFLVKRLK